MLSVSNLSVQFGKRILFDDVNITFSKGNCYGIIGANGSGKSTFLKVLAGELKPNSGSIELESTKRISVLEQNHNLFDSYSVLETVLRGNEKLFSIKNEMDKIYSNENFSDSDTERVGELQILYEEMNGWNSESDAAILLSNIGIAESLHNKEMKTLEGFEKVKVLIAQCLFDRPDVLIMDEPTNDLDYETIIWLVDFLSNYENTIIVVSHDRHFLDSICTHISDIDFNKITHFSGNYTFWHESSQIALRQKSQQNKKAEDKKKELQEFISRFSANVSKSKQATSRKKMIDKLNIDEIKPSSRRYPGIIFEQSREAGDQVLNVNNLSYKIDNEILFENISFNLKKGDKVIIHSKDSRASSIFFDILSNLKYQTTGSFEWGITINHSYLPIDNSDFFNSDENLIEWLRKYSKTDEEKEELYLRSFLGKMVFSGEEALKKCKVLSGGEKVRCMVSKIMMNRPNLIILDEPTNHLDLESITAFNNALKKYKGTLIISTHDHEFAQSLGNRIIELTPKGTIDRYSKFDDYIRDPKIKSLRHQLNS